MSLNTLSDGQTQTLECCLATKWGGGAVREKPCTRTHFTDSLWALIQCWLNLLEVSEATKIYSLSPSQHTQGQISFPNLQFPRQCLTFNRAATSIIQGHLKDNFTPNISHYLLNPMPMESFILHKAKPKALASTLSEEGKHHCVLRV